MPKSINRSRSRSRKGGKAANITPIQLSTPNSKHMTKLDQLLNKYKDKPVIIKGCSEKPIPETAQVQLIEKLLPTARTIMFGEACSTVPLYKRKK